MHQKVLGQVLQESDELHNILDNVIVHTSTEEEHDKKMWSEYRVARGWH